MMTEEQRLINETLKTSREYLTEQAQFTVERLKEYDKCSERMFALMALEYMRIAGLIQPASPALKLPDEMDTDHPRMRWVGMDELWGRIQGWNDCLEEVKRLNAPHTAPIETICATGGAEWVSTEDEPPRDGSWCIAIEEGDFAGDVVYWENGA